MNRNHRTLPSLIIVLSILAMALATFVFGQGGAGRPPQNGSGRGPARNSQQTSKGPARSTGRVASLAGTTWEWESEPYSEGQTTITYEFFSGGKVTYKTSAGSKGDGTWRQQGSRIVIDFGEDDVETGTITGNQMRGTMIEMVDGKKKTTRWRAKRQSDD